MLALISFTDVLSILLAHPAQQSPLFFDRSHTNLAFVSHTGISVNILVCQSSILITVTFGIRTATTQKM